MYQSSTRNNFLDILADPTAIAILASIAIHATIGASFPFFTQPEKEGKKVGPTTVKIVELTPSELQRIPQVPQTPTPQPSVPVPQPAIPQTQSVTPRTTEFSTTPQTIPFSPIRTPFDGETFKPSSGKKAQQAAPPKQPTAPIFDPESIFKPSPKPTKTPIPQGVTPKPTPQASPPLKTPVPQKTPTSKSTSPTTQPVPATDDDGGEQPNASTPTGNTTGQTQQPENTASPTSSPDATPTTQSPTQSSGDPTGNSGGNGFYGKYTAEALKQLRQYMTEYGVPSPYPSKIITRSYPQGMLCTKEPQAPFIVMMAVFDKVPDNPDAAILGTSSAPALKISTFKDRDTPEQQKLAEIATRLALEEANKADQNRPEKDQGKRVIYQYRVQFDPATCKN